MAKQYAMIATRFKASPPKFGYATGAPLKNRHLESFAINPADRNQPDRPNVTDSHRVKKWNLSFKSLHFHAFIWLSESSLDPFQSIAKLCGLDISIYDVDFRCCQK
jgi:hypothetical protein